VFEYILGVWVHIGGVSTDWGREYRLGMEVQIRGGNIDWGYEYRWR
jgi:hypothetical protein